MYFISRKDLLSQEINIRDILAFVDDYENLGVIFVLLFIDPNKWLRIRKMMYF
jgi:hypothetical protein